MTVRSLHAGVFNPKTDTQNILILLMISCPHVRWFLSPYFSSPSCSYNGAIIISREPSLKGSLSPHSARASL